MMLDIELLPDDVCSQLPAEELAEAIQLRHSGKYLGKFLSELYYNQGLLGGSKWEKEFAEACDKPEEMILVHSWLTEVLAKSDEIDPELKKIVLKFSQDIQDYFKDKS